MDPIHVTVVIETLWHIEGTGFLGIFLTMCVYDSTVLFPYASGIWRSLSALRFHSHFHIGEQAKLPPNGSLTLSLCPSGLPRGKGQ